MAISAICPPPLVGVLPLGRRGADGVPGGSTFNSTAAAAAQVVPAALGAILTLGYGGIGDGGAASWVRRGAVQPSHPGKFRDTAGAWFELFGNIVDPMMIGAVGDGVADDTTAVLNASLVAVALNLRLRVSRPHRIATAGAIGARCRFDGGRLIADGVTVTINGDFEAPIDWIFELRGAGLFLPLSGRPSRGYAEYFGAVPGGPDCAPAINACIAAFHETNFLDVDYFLAASVVVLAGNRVVRGRGSVYDASGRGCTRLLARGGSITNMLIGPAVAPAGGINAYLEGITIEDMILTRDTAPVASSTPRGMLTRHALYVRINNVRSAEHIHGFTAQADVDIEYTDCYSFRSIAATGGGDIFYGYYAYGQEVIGSGGNASLRFTRCKVGIGGTAVATTVGLYADGAMGDLFVNDFETSNCDVGVRLNGAGQTGLATEIDIRLKEITCDGHGYAGIILEYINKDANIQIDDWYATPSGAATDCDAGIIINSMLGSLTLLNGQVNGFTNSRCRGIHVMNSKGILSIGNKYVNCGTLPMHLVGCAESTFTDEVRNPTVQTNYAVTLEANCTNNEINTRVGGAGSAFTAAGILLGGATNVNNTLRVGPVTASCLQGGAAAKLVINGAQITATGGQAGNFVEGLLAA